MLKPLRLLSLAAAFALSAGIGTAAAQTLYVRKTPPGSTIEAVVNSTQAGSAQADENGDVRIQIDLPKYTTKSEIDARVYVDTCDQNRRVTITERDAAPLPPDDGCTRQEITGIFFIRRVSSVVVNVGSPVATLLLRQGSYSLRTRGPRRSAPTGLVAFGGATMANYADALDFGCSGVPTCSGDDSGYSYTVGAEYWFSKYISAEGGYFKPPDLTIEGSGEGFRFNSFLEPHLFYGAGKIGVPAGPVRFYFKAGFNYHRAESGTRQHIDEFSVTDENGVTTVTPARDTTVSADTSGWGWLLGGGAEAWVGRRFALYGEYGGAGIKGDAEIAEQGRIDNRISFFIFGGRILIR
jgi:Outer membrane protein beta-barrel domain